MDPEQSTPAPERRKRSFAPVIALVLIVGVLVAGWATAAGALLRSGSGAQDVATRQLTEDERLLDRGAGLLEQAGTVAKLREAGEEIGTLRLSLIDGQRRLADIEDPDVVDVALRAHRDIVRVLDGWAQLAAVDDADLAAWPRDVAGKVLKATNRLRDGNAAKVRKLAASGDAPADLDHARARAATLKVARFLVKAKDEQAT